MKKIERKYVFAGLVAFGLVFYGTSLYVSAQQAEYVAQIKILIAEQETTITSLAEVTDRNGADAVVSRIIKDCATEDRQRFDVLLGSLGELSSVELKEVNQLFGSCGSFFAERKALMTARLTREYEVYVGYVELLNIVDSKAKVLEYPLTKWSELVALEAGRSTLSSELVLIQKNIILALLEGVSIQSAQMLEQVTNAQEAKDTLSYTGVRIDALREAIIGL